MSDMSTELPFLGRSGLLSERVADELAQRILGGELIEGSRLPSEPDLSSQFGVSRSVIRDAIRNLATRGLIDVRQGSGTLVRAPSDERAEEAIFDLLVRSSLTMHDVWLAREALDLDAVARAARTRDDTDVAYLAERYKAMTVAEANRDWDRVEEEHVRFHLRIVAAGHLPALHAILLPMQRIILASGLPGGRDVPWGTPLHGPIVDAIALGDDAAALAAMRAHYVFVREPEYAELGATPFRDLPAAQERLRPRRNEP